MSLFLLIYLSIYGGSHVYCLLRTKAAFKLKPGATLLLGIFMLIMVVAPIGVLLLKKPAMNWRPWFFPTSAIHGWGLFFFFLPDR